MILKNDVENPWINVWAEFPGAVSQPRLQPKGKIAKGSDQYQALNIASLLIGKLQLSSIYNVCSYSLFK